MVPFLATLYRSLRFWRLGSRCLQHLECHRLNGSSSPVSTATSLFYGKAKNSTPRRIKTPDLIEIKFGTVDYVGVMQNFMQIPPRRASRQTGEIYAKIFIAIIYLFFSQLTYRSDPSADFCARWLKRRGLAQGCAFWGLKNLKLIFNVFIRKNRKNYNGAYGEN